MKCPLWSLAAGSTLTDGSRYCTSGSSLRLHHPSSRLLPANDSAQQWWEGKPIWVIHGTPPTGNFGLRTSDQRGWTFLRTVWHAKPLPIQSFLPSSSLLQTSYMHYRRKVLHTFSFLLQQIFCTSNPLLRSSCWIQTNVASKCGCWHWTMWLFGGKGMLVQNALQWV